jgi:hypothetical protein
MRGLKPPKGHIEEENLQEQVREVVVKCPSCGAENPDYGFYCGRCAKELPRVLGASRYEPDEQTRTATQSIWESNPPPTDALVAIAINVRRIFVIMMLGLFLTLGSILISWWTSYFWANNDNPNPADLRAVIAVWGIVSALVIALGLYYVVEKKGVTKL